MKSAVILIIFNRFDTVHQVLSQLRISEVPRLYIYCDGPRTEKNSEAEEMAMVRRLVLDEVNWPCEVVTNFRNENEGPRLAIGHAVNWFFEREEEGIILEHDCVPSQSFFTFCDTLLAHYREDERVMHISGNNFQFGRWRGDGSYYFSRITHIWGFATWRRAWKNYDVEMKQYPQFIAERRLDDLVVHARSRRFWQKTFDSIYSGEIQSWDYQWTFAVWCANGLAILPNVNLVSNVGFDKGALNTIDPENRLAFLPVQELTDLTHPSFQIPDLKADAWSIDEVFYPTYLKYGWQRLKKIFGMREV